MLEPTLPSRCKTAVAGALTLSLLCLFSCAPTPIRLTGPPEIKSVTAHFDGNLPSASGQTLAIYSGLPVSLFAELRSGSAPLTWSWDFGGGKAAGVAKSVSSHPQPTPGNAETIIGGQPGTYQCQVSVSNSLGTDARDFTLVISLPPLPDIDPLDYLPERMYPTRTTQLNRRSGDGLIADWSWDFGGGVEPNIVTEPSQNLRFGQPGSYPAVLTVGNASGSRSFPFTLRVIPLDPPLLSVLPQSDWRERALIPMQASNSRGPAETWHWDFGGAGTPNTSTLRHPVVTAGTEGHYQGSVTASNAAGSHTVHFAIVVKKLH